MLTSYRLLVSYLIIKLDNGWLDSWERIMLSSAAAISRESDVQGRLQGDHDGAKVAGRRKEGGAVWI